MLVGTVKNFKTGFLLKLADRCQLKQTLCINEDVASKQEVKTANKYINTGLVASACGSAGFADSYFYTNNYLGLLGFGYFTFLGLYGTYECKIIKEKFVEKSRLERIGTVGNSYLTLSQDVKTYVSSLEDNNKQANVVDLESILGKYERFAQKERNLDETCPEFLFEKHPLSLTNVLRDVVVLEQTKLDIKHE